MFSTFLLSYSNAQINYKDNIVNDISLYAGVYEGELDISLCCEMYEIGFGTIVFYYDGVSLKGLYDGVIEDNLTLDGNTCKYVGEYMEGQIFGKFVKSNVEGFLYYFAESDEHPIGSTSFLKKIGDSEAASKMYLDAEREFAEFMEFEKIFRRAFVNRNE